MIKETFKGCNWLKVIQKLLAVVLDNDKEYTLTIKEYKERRSNQANAYSWVLTDKLAEKMLICGVKLSKEEMHAEMIYRYGQPEYQNNQLVTVSVVDGVDVTDYYPYAREIGQSEAGGKLFSHWRIYRGSHTYSKHEMSLFIRGIVEECRELGIQTETPDEIERMISLMKEAR